MCDVNRNDSHAPFFWLLLHQCRARSRIFEKKNQKISKTRNNTQKHTNTHRDPDTHTQTHTQTDRQTDTDTLIESERERHKRPMASESSRGKKKHHIQIRLGGKNTKKKTHRPMASDSLRICSLEYKIRSRCVATGACVNVCVCVCVRVRTQLDAGALLLVPL